MRNFNKINVNEIKVGIRFSAPVFFDDGESMFLAEEKTVKPYHIVALNRWNVPHLLTYGHVMSESDVLDDLEEVEEIGEIEDLEDVEEVEAV